MKLANFLIASSSQSGSSFLSHPSGSQGQAFFWGGGGGVVGGTEGEGAGVDKNTPTC